MELHYHAITSVWAHNPSHYRILHRGAALCYKSHRNKGSCECVSREGGWALTESGDAIVGELELHQGHSCVQAMDGGQLVPAQPQHLEPGQVPTVHVRDRIFLDSTQD